MYVYLQIGPNYITYLMVLMKIINSTYRIRYTTSNKKNKLLL